VVVLEEVVVVEVEVSPVPLLQAMPNQDLADITVLFCRVVAMVVAVVHGLMVLWSSGALESTLC
jgi:hypothetical protein